MNPTISVELSMFFSVEEANEQADEAADSPTTFGTAKDSMLQMNDDVLAEIIEVEENSPLINAVRKELEELVAKFGYDYPVEDHIEWDNF